MMMHAFYASQKEEEFHAFFRFHYFDVVDGVANVAKAFASFDRFFFFALTLTMKEQDFSVER